MVQEVSYQSSTEAAMGADLKESTWTKMANHYIKWINDGNTNKTTQTLRHFALSVLCIFQSFFFAFAFDILVEISAKILVLYLHCDQRLRIPSFYSVIFLASRLFCIMSCISCLRAYILLSICWECRLKEIKWSKAHKYFYCSFANNNVSLNTSIFKTVHNFLRDIYILQYCLY